jgi:hypothetical protein
MTSRMVGKISETAIDIPQEPVATIPVVATAGAATTGAATTGAATTGAATLVVAAAAEYKKGI